MDIKRCSILDGGENKINPLNLVVSFSFSLIFTTFLFSGEGDLVIYSNTSNLITWSLQYFFVFTFSTLPVSQENRKHSLDPLRSSPRLRVKVSKGDLSY